MRQRLESLLIGLGVGIGLGGWGFISLHAVPLVAAATGGIVGLVVFLIVASKPNPADASADAAWREAAKDLPPTSDRLALEAAQEHIARPGEGRGRRRDGSGAGSEAHKMDVDAGAGESEPVLHASRAGRGLEPR